jgi:hypothetical protein
MGRGNIQAALRCNGGSVNVDDSSVVGFGGQLINTGTLNIQSGTLSLTGGYTLTNCTLNFGISSAASFGKLALSGALGLNNTTLGTTANGYTPAKGDSIPLITYTSETGIFSAFNLPPGANWQPNYGNTAFSLIVSSVTAPFLALQFVLPLHLDGGLNLLMLGPSNANYTIQSITNLSTPNWVPLTNFFMTNSSFYYTDTNATNYPLRIFQAVTP